jgi:GNAT superfamily N-acetyltransferase
MRIRPARPGDEHALARIHRDMGDYYAELAPERFQPPAQDGLVEMLREELEEANGLQLVAELDGEVIASLDARLIPPAEDAQFGFSPDHAAPRLRIDYLATAAAHRRSGAGSALVAAAEAWGREHGARVAETTTYHDSPSAFPFWTERAGYEQRSVNLRKPL